MNDRRPSPEELAQYHDGQLTAEQVVWVEGWIKRSPEVAKLAYMLDIKGALADIFEQEADIFAEESAGSISDADRDFVQQLSQRYARSRVTGLPIASEERPQLRQGKQVRVTCQTPDGRESKITLDRVGHEAFKLTATDWPTGAELISITAVDLPFLAEKVAIASKQVTVRWPISVLDQAKGQLASQLERWMNAAVHEEPMMHARAEAAVAHSSYDVTVDPSSPDRLIVSRPLDPAVAVDVVRVNIRYPMKVGGQFRSPPMFVVLDDPAQDRGTPLLRGYLPVPYVPDVQRTGAAATVTVEACKAAISDLVGLDFDQVSKLYGDRPLKAFPLDEDGGFIVRENEWQVHAIESGAWLLRWIERQGGE